MPEATRTAIKAAIKRATRAGWREVGDLTDQALSDLETIYREAAAQIREDILNYAGQDGTLRLEVMRRLLNQTEARLSALGRARDDLLEPSMREAAALGVAPFAGAGLAAALSGIADEALHQARTFISEDGLQLSDRLWRLDNHAREALGTAIQSAVVQGTSARRAAADFLARGSPVPADIAAKMGLAAAGRMARLPAEMLLTGEGTPLANALRVFRTEINRAHGEAYQAAAFEQPDVIGTRFVLSPNHPAPDICDMHAAVNRYGLGPGVYPKGRNPWPAHPNTLSFTVVVFRDEVSAADRAGREDRLAWLARQTPATQAAAVGGLKKAEALRRGILRESEITTTWRELKRKYARRGIDI